MEALTTPLAELVRTSPIAARVFLRHRLDYSCGGRRTLAEACETLGLDAAAIAAEIEAEAQLGGVGARWDQQSPAELTDFIECRYHAAVRRDLPELIDGALRTERVHAGKPGVPLGLGAVLAELYGDLERHMSKEEQVLFPLIRRGGPPETLCLPLELASAEHDLHRDYLAQIRELTDDLRPPPHATPMWRALYRKLEAMEADLIQHIHLENNVLFEVVNTRGGRGARAAADGRS